MKLRIVACLAVALLVTVLIIPLTAEEGVVKEVTVTGRGESETLAKQDAMRNAVEQAAGAEIASFSQTKDFQLVRDEVVSRANGYCSSVEVLESSEKLGIWTVKIRAKVNVGMVTSDWGAIAVLVEQKGHPRIVVWIGQKIDGYVSESEEANSMVITHFLNSGLRVVDFDQIRQVAEKEKATADYKNDISQLIALAGKFNAELTVKGAASASYSHSKQLGSRNMYFYSADCTLSVVRTSDGRTLMQQSWTLNSMEMPSATSKESAAKLAIKAIVDKMAPEALRSITRRWIQDLFTANEVTLSFTKCSYRFRRGVVEQLRLLEDVTSVSEMNYAEQVLELTIMTTLSTSQLLDRMVDKKVITIDMADTAKISGNKMQIECVE